MITVYSRFRLTSIKSFIHIASVFCMLSLALVGSSNASASTCPINMSSPNAEFSANAYVYGYNGVAVCGTLAELPVEDTYAGGGQHYMETALRIEQPGQILQEIYATGNGYGSNNHIVHSAFMHFGDVIITGGAAATVNAALNIFYGGDQISCAASNCYTGAGFWVRVNGGGYYSFDYLWGAYETGSVPLANLPVGTPFNLNIQFQATNNALAFTGGSQTWDGFLQFAANNVFTLPDGYTINSAEGMIVNNQWTAVPVPAAAWLFGSGLLGLVGLARRKE